MTSHFYLTLLIYHISKCEIYCVYRLFLYVSNNDIKERDLVRILMFIRKKQQKRKEKRHSCVLCKNLDVLTIRYNHYNTDVEKHSCVLDSVIYYCQFVIRFYMSRYNDGVIFKSRCERVLLFQNFSLKNFYLRKHVGKKINFLLICVGEYKVFFFQTKTFSQGDNGASSRNNFGVVYR